MSLCRQRDLEVVERLLKAVEMLGDARLKRTPEVEQPLVHRLAERYPLSAKERDLLKASRFVLPFPCMLVNRK